METTALGAKSPVLTELIALDTEKVNRQQRRAAARHAAKRLRADLGDTWPVRQESRVTVARGTRSETTRRAQDSNLYGLAPSGFQDRRLTS